MPAGSHRAGWVHNNNFLLYVLICINIFKDRLDKYLGSKGGFKKRNELCPGAPLLQVFLCDPNQ